MKGNNFLVLATFEKENMKENKGEFFIGRRVPFFCGSNLNEAENIYNKLPNKDKSIVDAAVKFMPEPYNEMIAEYEILEVVK